MRKYYAVVAVLLFAVSAKLSATAAGNYNGMWLSGSLWDVPTHGLTIVDRGNLYIYNGIRQVTADGDYALLRALLATNTNEYWRLSIGVALPYGSSLQPGRYMNGSQTGGSPDPSIPQLEFYSESRRYTDPVTGWFEIKEIGYLNSGQLYAAVDAYQENVADPSKHMYLSYRANSKYDISNPTPTPEPSSVVLLLMSLIPLMLLRIRHRKTRT